MAADGHLWGPFLERHAAAYAGRGSAVGTHAIVIGVSAYPALRGGKSQWPMEELNSAAISAVRFAEWLNESFRHADGAPLRSLRVLLSPSEAEAKTLGERVGDAPRAKRNEVKDAVKAWLADCEAMPHCTAVMYVAGHGVYKATRGTPFLLLEDLDADLDVSNSVNLRAVVNGLGSLRLRSSYAFLDCCQTHLPRKLNWNSGWAHSHTPRKESRDGGGVYASAAEGEDAHGEALIGSYFVDALLQALEFGAIVKDGQGRWVVTSGALAKALGKLIRKPNQRTWPVPLGQDVALHRPKGPLFGVLTVQLEPGEPSEFDLALTFPDRSSHELPLENGYSRFLVGPGLYSATLRGRSGGRCEPPSLGGEVPPFGLADLPFSAR